jgi:DNA-binding transcriptional ArsR family regulator
MLEKAYELFFDTLSNKTRLRIIDFLRMGGPRRATDIAKEMMLNQTTVSHNLRRLERCGFVVVKQNRKERIYRINKDAKPLLDLLEKHTEAFCRKCVEGKR